MKGYFEGRYFKHQKGRDTVCLIAGHADSGEFIQVIADGRVWQFKGSEGCRISRRGVRVDLPGIKGEVRYGSLTPLKYSIMGPFRFFPMECSHSVISMYHSLRGSFEIEGKKVDMNGGRGYMEGDRGRSFPKEYMWFQCNDFKEPCSIMASVADIPFMGGHFKGCICVVWYEGREYRLATYKGVRLCEAHENGLVLKQGRLKLEAEFKEGEGLPLKSPFGGQMNGVIHESNETKGRFRFWAGNKLLFDYSSENVGFECNLDN